MHEYLIFVRDDAEKALECVGEVTADSDDQAREKALDSGADAVEMVLVPRARAHWVVRANDEAQAKATSGSSDGAGSKEAGA